MINAISHNLLFDLNCASNEIEDILQILNRENMI